jgi:hypothetical protein
MIERLSNVFYWICLVFGAGWAVICLNEAAKMRGDSMIVVVIGLGGGLLIWGVGRGVRYILTGA